jgi:Ca2+-binding RTX toxin-like protein
MTTAAKTVSEIFSDFTPSRVIWVSPNGNNGNNGSEGSPLKSIQAAVNKATPGTAIMVKGGTYNESLNLSGLHGTKDKPIVLASADGQGAAKIVGGSSAATITANGISNVAIQDFHVVSNTNSGDMGGFKIWGPWSNPPKNLLISGNTITGKGTDGFKLFQGANNVLVVGNKINGNWRQEAIDNVSVENVVYAHNTITGSAKNTGITIKAGSRDVELVGNTFDLSSKVGIFVGGHGNSRLNREFPNYWKGFEAKNVQVHDNVVTGKATGKSLVFVGSNNSTVEGNHLAGAVGSVSHSVGGATYKSFSNKVVNNSVGNSGFFKPDGGQSQGYNVSGNTVGGSKPAAGAASNLVDGFMKQVSNGKAGVTPSVPPVASVPEETGPAVPDPVKPGASVPAGPWAARADFTKTVNGTSKSETVAGTAGNDKMVGNGGNDVLQGGKGDDLYIVDLGDRVVEEAGGGIDEIFLWAKAHTMESHVENLTIKFANGATVTGNGLANIITGGAGADVIDGGAGDDLLTGGGGADTFVVKAGQGSDTITDFTNQDRVQLDGTRFAKASEAVAALRQVGADTLLDLGNGQTLTFKGVKTAALTEKQFELTGSVAQLPVPQEPTTQQPSPTAPEYVPGSWAETAGPGRTVTGGKGSETLQGSTANDKMVGNGGEDTLVGGRGDDTYIVDSARDTTVEKAGEGVDQIFLWTKAHSMGAHVENLVIKQSNGATVTGNDLANIITGGAGADVIRGGLGADRLSGGGGNDLFVFQKGELAGDRIEDFDGKGAGAGDALRFEGFGSGTKLTNAGDIWTLHHAAGAETFQLAGVTELNANDVVFA